MDEDMKGFLESQPSLSANQAMKYPEADWAMLMCQSGATQSLRLRRFGYLAVVASYKRCLGAPRHGSWLT